MEDRSRSRAELIEELIRLRRKVASLERKAGPRAKDARGTEAALSECRSKLEALLEQPMVGVYLVREGFFAYVNCQLACIFGYEPEELTGARRPAGLACPEDRPIIEENLEKLISGRAAYVQHEFQGIRKDGQTVYAEVYCQMARDEGTDAVLGIVIDRSDQKKLGEQLVRAERIKAIGALAGGIAHDFNNLLMGIQGHASLLLHRLAPADLAYDKLKGIEDLVHSGADLTRKLLGFASGAKYEISPADLNPIIGKTSELFGRTRKEIAVKCRLQEDLCFVDANSGQIEQMLLNLYVNAWQAMPKGGTLFLATENVLLDRRFVQPYSLRPGKYAKVSVADTGEGMDEKTKERIFEPFFTTRKAAKGTGLGLASVYNIVKGHGGIVTVSSAKGRGTTFDIYLPASKRAADKVSSPPPESHQVENGAETILLVDDEEPVITVSKDMLEALGYSVLVAGSGQEAVEVFEKSHHAIDLVILDVVMPDMGGEETLARLRAIEPEVVVILSSGYNLDGRVTRIMRQGCKAFIQKPFTINVLSQKLREALDS